MLKKALQPLLKDLLALAPKLWMQVVGLAATISLNVLLISLHTYLHTALATAYILTLALLLTLFSIAIYSMYLIKQQHRKSAKVGLRKLLGTSSWQLLLEVSLQTGVLIVLAMFISFGLIDVSTLLMGLKFSFILQNIGVAHYALFMLVLFLISMAVLVIIQGLALAPKPRATIDKTTSNEADWVVVIYTKLANIGLVLCLLTGIGLVVFVEFFAVPKQVGWLGLAFYGFLLIWCLLTRKQVVLAPENIE